MKPEKAYSKALSASGPAGSRQRTRTYSSTRSAAAESGGTDSNVSPFGTGDGAAPSPLPPTHLSLRNYPSAGRHSQGMARSGALTTTKPAHPESPFRPLNANSSSFIPPFQRSRPLRVIHVRTNEASTHTAYPSGAKTRTARDEKPCDGRGPTPADSSPATPTDPKQRWPPPVAESKQRGRNEIGPEGAAVQKASACFVASCEDHKNRQTLRSRLFAVRECSLLRETGNAATNKRHRQVDRGER